MADIICTDCKRATELVVDHTAGDTVCSECGLVLESCLVDESAEWRNFSGDTGGERDPSRVGAAVNPLLAGGGLTTLISGSGGGGLLTRMQDKVVADVEGPTLRAFKDIGLMADRLILMETTKDQACEIYRRVEGSKCAKPKNQVAVLAACLYIACRCEGIPFTLKEFSYVASGATKKEIGREALNIVKLLKIEMGEATEMETIHPRAFLQRFCSTLGMSHEDVKAVHETVNRLEEIDIRRCSVTIAAAIIYMITQLSSKPKTLREIANATSAAEATIKNAYKDLYPHASKIIPEWYAKEKDLLKLVIPKIPSKKLDSKKPHVNMVN